MAVKERKGKIQDRKSMKIAHGIGFVACYEGKEIAFAKDFGVLLRKSVVKERIGHKSFIIKHNVPEGVLAVY